MYKCVHAHSHVKKEKGRQRKRVNACMQVGECVLCMHEDAYATVV